MIILEKSATAFGSDAFKSTLKNEIETLSASQLPLQQALERSSYVSGDNFSVNLISTGKQDGRIVARIGVFYAGIIAGCNCADDPTPPDEIQEYCELELTIAQDSGETLVRLVD